MTVAENCGTTELYVVEGYAEAEVAPGVAVDEVPVRSQSGCDVVECVDDGWVVGVEAAGSGGGTFDFVHIQFDSA